MPSRSSPTYLAPPARCTGGGTSAITPLRVPLVAVIDPRVRMGDAGRRDCAPPFKQGRVVVPHVDDRPAPLPFRAILPPPLPMPLPMPLPVVPPPRLPLRAWCPPLVESPSHRRHSASCSFSALAKIRFSCIDKWKGPSTAAEGRLRPGGVLDRDRPANTRPAPPTPPPPCARLSPAVDDSGDRFVLFNARVNEFE